ncbi:hypothetical protein ES288_D08G124700v1 [Gossypium darwinii]|uniref:Uncharacterized protein n=1 Tax=Gossypium darwinii TaxID=34276 RepID=A0A5D2BLA2_GOSDA|nr:hypothetical protein ES288_D08G124700v1 [Gossypium darwinii]
MMRIGTYKLWRSMGISAKSKINEPNSKNYISGIVKRRNLSEFDMSKLGIGLMMRNPKENIRKGISFVSD